MKLVKLLLAVQMKTIYIYPLKDHVTALFIKHLDTVLKVTKLILSPQLFSSDKPSRSVIRPTSDSFLNPSSLSPLYCFAFHCIVLHLTHKACMVQYLNVASLALSFCVWFDFWLAVNASLLKLHPNPLFPANV